VNTPILRVEELHKHFPLSPKITVHAVNGVSFELEKGGAVGLVGESGCGKSTIARCIVWLERVTKGRILFQGEIISELSSRRFRPMRRFIQMVFQDPTMSLNPLLTVRQTLREPLKVHRIGSTAGEMSQRVKSILDLVKLEQRLIDRHPRQLSGGQKQRVGIARALISDPELVILDEPTSSLDMSIRIHIIDLLKDLQEKLGVAYLFISHDLSTVRSLCSRVLVMYLGQLVETGTVEEIFDRPLHL
jgi:oligopeptide transport system ATP-binding protein